MKTELQKSLATLAPSIAIETRWSPDFDSGPISKECDGFDPSDDHKWGAWQSEIRATATINGEEISGNAYLGGTFELYDDNPAESNPTISGYENQMTAEALQELQSDLEALEATVFPHGERLIAEIEAALAYLKEEARKSYEAQRAEIEAQRTPAI
jgi:hypothetical protein